MYSIMPISRLRNYLLVLFSVISICSFGQQPTGLPTVKADSGNYDIGYIRSKVLGFQSVGDTMIRPRYAGALRCWQQLGDTTLWLWTGQRWLAMQRITATSNFIIDGMVVTKTATPLQYSISSGHYVINNVQYASAGTPAISITSPCADPTQSRIIVFWANNLGAVGREIGTCSTTPLMPDIDEGTQIQLSFVIQTNIDTFPTPPAQTADWHTTGNSAAEANNSNFIGPNASGVDFNVKMGFIRSGWLNSVNTLWGYNGMQAITSGTQNAAFGSSSLPVTTTGSFNTAVGHNALSTITTGSNNTALGRFAGSAASATGSQNVFVGSDINASGAGSGNTFVGYAIAANPASLKTESTALGFTAGLYSNETKATHLGAYAGRYAFPAVETFGSGTCNLSGGYAAYGGKRSGSFNVALGDSALRGAIGDSDYIRRPFTGSSIVAVGHRAGKDRPAGDRGIFIGDQVTMDSAYVDDVMNIGDWFVRGNGASTIGSKVLTPSALLSLPSTTRGFLPPVMSSAQRLSIASPATGLVVFDITLQCLEFYNGASWVGLCGTAPTGFIPLAGTTVGNPVTGDIEVQENKGLSYYSPPLLSTATANFWESTHVGTAVFGWRQDVNETALTDGGMFIGVNGKYGGVTLNADGALAIQSETDQSVNINVAGGNVGIGTASPAGILDVSANSGDERLLIDQVGHTALFQAGSVSNRFFIDGQNNNYIIEVGGNGQIDVSDAATSMLLMKNGGFVGIGTGTVGTANLRIADLAGTGTRAVLATSDGDLTAPISDVRAKEQILDLNYGISTIMALRPVSFYYKKEYKNYGTQRQIGFIAQEVEKVLPNTVFTSTKTGLKGINKEDIISVLVSAMQQQQKQITIITARVEKLEKENAKLKGLLKQW